MANSLKNVLQTVGSHLSDNLICADGLSQIAQIGNLLPNFPTISDAIFECHLGSSTPRTDFSVAFSTLNQGRETLVDSSKTLANLSYASSVWDKIHNFSAHWANIKSPLYENVKNIWLEFDVDQQFLGVPEPSLFFGTQNIIDQKENLSSSNQNSIIAESKWVADEALSLLFNSFLKEEVKQHLLTCFESLPSDGEVFQIGVMLPRKSESKAIRLCAEDIANEQILDYLNNIGWSDSSNQLSSLLSNLSSVVDEIKLNFAIEDKIFPKIGLECYLYKQPINSPKWKLFQDYLIKNKLCTLDQANAILNWSGFLKEKHTKQLKQDNFVKASAFDSSKFKSVIARRLHHIKIVYQPNKPLQAKAYLWFGHRWLSKDGKFQESI